MSMGRLNRSSAVAVGQLWIYFSVLVQLLEVNTHPIRSILLTMTMGNAYGNINVE